MDIPQTHAVTGAFGYSGKHIAAKLLEKGHQVITLTNALDRPDPFQGRVKAYPFKFDDPGSLTESLKGVSVLYNTYWVRFNHATFTHADAVRNTITLFHAARDAGVKRIVHVSITNPSEDSPFEYFRGKALLENELRQLGVSHSILRPAVLFGEEDILINNIAWALRMLPVFGVFGDGMYKIQPIHVLDFALLAVEQGAAEESRIVNAIGPETFTYRALVEEIAEAIGVHRPILSVSPSMGLLAGTLIGKKMNDVFITRDEIHGLMAGLLCVEDKPRGAIRLTQWCRDNASTLGRTYASELGRRRAIRKKG